jgi:hypothetical protein
MFNKIKKLKILSTILGLFIVSMTHSAWITKIENQTSSPVKIRSTIPWAKNIGVIDDKKTEYNQQPFDIPPHSSIKTEHMYIGWNSANEGIYVTVFGKTWLI